MPELTPTLATAYLYENGSVIVNTTRLPRGTAHERVPCLILPAPRPIEQCPEEWKDGRNVLVYIDDPGFSNGWVEGWWCSGWRCFMGGVHPTHIMLPPPAPQEAQDAR